MNRRQVLATVAAAAVGTLFPRRLWALGGAPTDPAGFTRVAALIRERGIDTLPIGKAIVEIGKSFLGTPYAGGTLELNPTEQCVVNFEGLDCVTFFELALDLARIAKKNTITFDALINEVTFTRYRDGKLTDYTSRLHYTCEWFLNNHAKHVVDNRLTQSLGGVPYVKKIDFMSTHADKYRQLRETPTLVPTIRSIETRIAQQKIVYIPKARVASIEAKLADGDIIGITTTIIGIDCSHTGLIVREGEHARFMHASSNSNKVIIADGTLSDYLNSVTKHTGIIVVRPLEPGSHQ